MSYEKQPDYACEQCHRSFKNQRALDAHNRDVHPQTFADITEADADESVQKYGLVECMDSPVVVRGRLSIRDGDETD